MRKLSLVLLTFMILYSGRILAVRGETYRLAGFSQYDGDGNSLPSATFNLPKDMVVSGGFMYVVDSNNNAIRKINMTNGIISTLAGNGIPGNILGYGADARLNSPCALAVDPTGNTLFVADTNNSQIKGINLLTGLVYNIAGAPVAGYLDGPTGNAKFTFPKGVAADPAGRYIYVSDTNNSRIRRIDTQLNSVVTLAGSGNGYVEGSGTNIKLNYPQGLSIDPAGTKLYIADTYNQCIRVIDLVNNTTSALVAGNTLDMDYREGVGSAAWFKRPTGVSLDQADNILYVADNMNNMVRKIDLSNNSTSPVAGTLTAGIVNGTGTAALFKNPNSVFYNTAESKVYVADSGNNIIRDIYTTLSNQVTRYCGMYVYDGDGNSLPSATFSGCSDVAVNTLTGRIYVADAGNNVIRMIDQNGRLSTIAGDGNRGYIEGIGAVARFYFPNSIAIDPLNNKLYVCDTNNNRIRVIDLNDPNYTVSFVAGSGSATFADGIGAAASFNVPAEIDLDYFGGRVFVADKYNNRIRMITLSTGKVSTVVGTGTAGYAQYQTIGSATLTLPEGVVYQPGLGIYSDGLFVADTGNHMIRRFPLGSSTTVTVTDLAGLNTSPGYVDGTLTVARFNNPSRLTVDMTNLQLYISDNNNHAVRSMDLWTTGYVNTLAGNGTAGYAEGVTQSALFNAPRGLVYVDQGQKIYIADSANNNIRIIDAFYPSPTPTFSSTVNGTATISPTVTVTCTQTPTITQTLYYTSTQTPSITVTDTVSQTQTFTGTPTFTVTYSATATVTPTFSITATSSETATSTATPTISDTWTITQTPTVSLTDTPSCTPTQSGTATVSFTVTQTSTDTPVYSPTQTQTVSPSYTASPSSTATCTVTQTSTAGMTLTQTPYLSPTSTPQDTYTVTATPQAMETMTATITGTSPTATATAIDFFQKTIYINDLKIYPNPSFGRLIIAYQITGSAKTVKLKVYTSAFRLVREFTYYNQGSGVYENLYDDFKAFDNGVYHVLLEATGTGNDSMRRVDEMVIVR